MSRQKRNFSAKFKSDLVIELLKGEKDLNTLAVENNIQPNLLRNATILCLSFLPEWSYSFHVAGWVPHPAVLHTAVFLLTHLMWKRPQEYSCLPLHFLHAFLHKSLQLRSFPTVLCGFYTGCKTRTPYIREICIRYLRMWKIWIEIKPEMLQECYYMQRHRNK